MSDKHPSEISAQTLMFVVGIALVLVTAVICLFIRVGGTVFLGATYALLLFATGLIVAFAARFMSSDE